MDNFSQGMTGKTGEKTDFFRLCRADMGTNYKDSTGKARLTR
ncbi:hypothetical protein BN439_1667 [Erwinia amylovora Ea644]|uniref:Uncharacterized protein n=3 Tax=Erwinia amylovora TaxID=552 RepID=A0A831EQC1_ERWAM|nr:hypothetical protein EaACW_1344 [Erwinia amylovora ACW56400]QJQ54948.1 hypothetical protein EHX00_2246 [Erwinia amylovora]CBA20285.1 hypothetical protein predicted by Glimmer/Critica [Erwinia amylovora CFBP1430]CBX80193.1 hypothetical protein predicted by Glimmer/Critica [Erwinia amylovora ATCC BAA-2158]CCO78191.1 hypothetical protein BN432_1382 [Erwinia amylovora Ea356]CCO85775.1 hypothetical protein BN434_1376 [Erwinia amylovora CFBP 2585]CCO89561.1 hypothetical protein BN435_1378 [Erwin